MHDKAKAFSYSTPATEIYVLSHKVGLRPPRITIMYSLTRKTIKKTSSTKHILPITITYGDPTQSDHTFEQEVCEKNKEPNRFS